jgi:hypothetical protein
MARWALMAPWWQKWKAWEMVIDCTIERSTALANSVSKVLVKSYSGIIIVSELFFPFNFLVFCYLLFSFRTISIVCFFYLPLVGVLHQLRDGFFFQ